MKHTQAVGPNHAVKGVKPSNGPLSPDEFVRAVSRVLVPISDPALRPWMQAYMKGQFEFLGIKTPVRRKAVAELARMQRGATAKDLIRAARILWALPEREYQYVAVDLLAKHIEKLSPRELPAVFKLVRLKSWWDTVDALAAGVIGKVVRNARAENPEVQTEMDKALRSSDFWVRRVAILHQLGWRGQTDAGRLFAYALACGHEKEFFIRKAIGWALRDYARHAPAEVRDFVRANGDKLSALTVREAAKHL
ncbi:DNA alkylation repair protein [Occallatibacter savannae]|uniref:DNA alkylation repair protein n=1 Tax=Occallatibacter savannae TaxID=1002691 RepID=UPI000D69216E|nr:DNA alkylation repair protein [Occallatibacter savannae]